MYTNYIVAFQNIGNPKISTKLFSTMALVKAMALIVNPVKMSKKFFDVDVSGDGACVYFEVYCLG